MWIFFINAEPLLANHLALLTTPDSASIRAAVLVANLTAGRLAARFGVRRTLVGGALLMTVGLALLPLDVRIPCAAIVGQLAPLGLGLGLIVPAMTSRSWAASTAVDQESPRAR